jgi:hypothetical protein
MDKVLANNSVSQDETINSLRRVCDRYFHKRAIGHVFERGQGLARQLYALFTEGGNLRPKRVSIAEPS